MNTVSTALALPVEQPLARAVGGDAVAHRHRRVMQAVACELGPQRLGHVGHLVEIGRAEAMHPAEHLLGTEWFLTLLDEPVGERCSIEIEKIDHV
jgi:hypothetical protein